MTDAGVPGGGLEAIASEIVRLDSAESPVRYTIEGSTVRAVWKFDDDAWTARLQSSGASKNFVYTVLLDESTRSFRWREQDAGFSNGRYRAYRGYSRGFSVNLLTLLLAGIRKADAGWRRRQGLDADSVPLSVSDLTQPLLSVLERHGWRNAGVTL